MDLLTWAATAVAPGAKVVRARRLPGATGAVDIRAIDIETPTGAVHKLVVRRYTDREWLAREPDLARREAAALELLRRSAVPAPEPIAVDDTTVLMTRLPGRERWVPPSIRRLAEVAPAIHDVVPPPDFRRYRRYTTQPPRPPAWATDTKLWELAIAVAETAAWGDGDATFIHRDHHPGNVLWSRGRVTGVVDWVEACVGPPAVDSARCRMNLWDDAGRDAATAYTRCDGVVTDPVWDIVDGLDWLWDDGPPAEARATLEAFIAHALAELGR